MVGSPKRTRTTSEQPSTAADMAEIWSYDHTPQHLHRIAHPYTVPDGTLIVNCLIMLTHNHEAESALTSCRAGLSRSNSVITRVPRGLSRDHGVFAGLSRRLSRVFLGPLCQNDPSFRAQDLLFFMDAAVNEALGALNSTNVRRYTELQCPKARVNNGAAPPDPPHHTLLRSLKHMICDPLNYRQIV